MSMTNHGAVLISREDLVHREQRVELSEKLRLGCWGRVVENLGSEMLARMREMQHSIGCSGGFGRTRRLELGKAMVVI